MSSELLATTVCAAAVIGTIGCGGHTLRTSPDAADGTAGDVAAGDRAGDAVACAAQAAGNCETVRTVYTSNDGAALSMNPELASCARFISFDGCGRLVFSFDGDGCLESELSSPDGDDHLGDLRKCFAAALGTRRWPCLAAGTVTFEESCFGP